jgi:glucokinase
MAIVVGLDIGGTSYKLGAWDGAARLDWRQGIAPSASAVAGEVADYIAEQINAFCDGLPTLPVALGIGSCGLIADGVILQSPNTPWDHLPLTSALGARLSLPVSLINDADAFLIDGLSVLEQQPRAAIGLTLGTGLGTALWLQGRLLAGGSGISPEGGHITLDFNGPLANTGIPGTWESLACRSALLQYFTEAGGPLAADPLEVAAAAKQGDAAARRAWERYGQALGAGLGSLCNVFSPEVVLIGGGLAGAHAWFDAALTEALNLHMLHAMPRPKLRFLDERADSVAHGAARYALLEQYDD